MVLTLFAPEGGKFAPLSYFNIASKLTNFCFDAP